MDPQSARSKIQENIQKHRFHLYLIEGPLLPRYAYTVGLSLTTGYELAFAGGSFFRRLDATAIIDRLAKNHLEKATQPPSTQTLEPYGEFYFERIHSSWVNQFLNAIPDYFPEETPPCFQILPDASHSTRDVPQMAAPYSTASHTPWQWIEKPWPFQISKDALAATDLPALRGKRVQEVVRWEEERWELFASPGDQVNPDDCRIVPLAVLLSLDPSLEIVTRLEIGKGYWRDGEKGDWNRWNW
ncbi:MAG: DUF4262 domain-containing protein [Pirellulaceae bacterium]